jgi:anaerobic nitric oxide reductase flavorubredoxin
MITSLAPDIFCVGCVDWTVRDFHGYDARRGTTYNAYLLRDEQTVLVDAVKEDFSEQLLENIHVALAAAEGDAQRTIDYIVCNHAEPDHSGALPKVLQAFPQTAVVCNEKCRVVLGQYYDTAAWKFQVVGDGDTLPIGRRTLRFLDTPMVHWPESMFTYAAEDRLLFSMDVFGQHLAAAGRLDDELPQAVILDEAKTYYANILMPYPRAVETALAKLAPLEIETIAPSHGLVWRSGAVAIRAAYADWIASRPKAKVLVIYDTMWQSTRQMAEAILAGAAQEGVDARLLALGGTSLTQLAAEVLDAAAVAVGSPTLNRNPLPAVAAALSYLQGLRPLGKIGLAFGSYGWGTGGPETVDEGLRAMGWEMLAPPLKSRYRPTAEALGQCRAAGKRLAEQARRVYASRSA